MAKNFCQDTSDACSGKCPSYFYVYVLLAGITCRDINKALVLYVSGQAASQRLLEAKNLIGPEGRRDTHETVI